MFIGKNFVELPQVGSTNRFATELLKTGAPEGTVVITDRQTEGRGQAGNDWLSEPGNNLTFSIIFRPTFLDSKRIFLLNKMISVALCSTISVWMENRNQTRIKWPNDILVNHKKVAGILMENHIGKDHVNATVVGIGINVNQRQFDARYGKASSLAVEGGNDIDRDMLLARLLEMIEARYLQLKAGKADEIERRYFEYMYGYQEFVDLIIEGKQRKTYIVGVDKHGRLAVEMDNQLKYYGIKEVQFCL